MKHLRHLLREYPDPWGGAVGGRKRRRARFIAAGVLCFCAGAAESAETKWNGIGLGVNFGMVEHGAAADIGGDVQVGYEVRETKHFNIGVQWQGLKVGEEEDVGLGESGEYGDDDLSLRSNAVYLTVRPRNKWLQWLQFKGGLANANYKVFGDEGLIDRSGANGIAFGLGVVAPSDRFRIHMLDYQRLLVGGERFDVYSVTVLVLLAL